MSAAPSWSEIAVAIGFFLTLSGAGWGVWWKINDVVKATNKDTRDQVAGVSAKAEMALLQIAEHKLYAAETFATKDGLAASNAMFGKTITDGFDRVDKRLDVMTDRLDRVIEASHKPTRRTA